MLKDKLKKLPPNPGVYIMKGQKDKVLYIGKAGNLKKRVSSYFSKKHTDKTASLIEEVKKIDYIETPTAIEALILEAELIKKYKPPYNFKEKDDKSFWHVEITKDEFPRVLLVRGKDKPQGERSGPFTNASDIRAALRIIRKIFPFSTHTPNKLLGKSKRPCFEAQIGLCPGTCVGSADRDAYKKNIKNIKLLFKGNKKKILKDLEKEMKQSAEMLNFEEAIRLRGQLFALNHVQDIALIAQAEKISTDSDLRIEGYDVSNISGTSPVGSMAVFKGDSPELQEYKKFKIRTIHQPDDVGMLREVLERRFKNEWPLPDLVLVDGGKPQVNTARQVLEEAGLSIPLVGIAKGPKRDKNEFIGTIPKGFSRKTLIQVRDEAHRFAISYHKKVRSKRFLS
ncbi:MAG: hypothetical protein COT89_02230 [Candidatus Colwellbacteria bacterium CG10_big_fil_rev_8_21_14_0_10_42_22]|uniref:Excinuclease ABC subunit C n=1 Tax=Candidatus Colwellbacteria bacterium CG10_big_fil_rev_8_21_14_0_10_42_22 TaxID=1974540 RepID=A0A2H0VFK1_9BACT|nr:MAG: hypothetical protein COT89_02230 [Candidatus Colwellbacteria bacterium CG10_big_fil_rev_8_21_14_0_10_42_22]